MVDRVARLNSELDVEWGERHSLKKQVGTNGVYSIESLVRKGAQREALESLKEEPQLRRALFDHARHFRTRTATTTAVIVTAPYLNATLGYFPDTRAANARIHEIASALELCVRVGHPEDTIYLSENDGDPTLPIVWWNPSRFALPLPQIQDPNMSFVSRMSTF